jgi:hypothetical protein
MERLAENPMHRRPETAGTNAETPHQPQQPNDDSAANMQNALGKRPIMSLRNIASAH